ncbi:MAG: (2Fe-2S)-binding protein, partial [Pseudomonadota bacterium]
FLLSRRRLTPNEAAYWSRSRGNGLWRYQLAGEQLPPNWAQSARVLLCSPGQDAGWIEYFDPANHQYRAARIVKNRIESCLYISAGQHLPDYDWLEPLFRKESISGHERIALLGGKPLPEQDDTGPTVCACFGVGRNALLQAIRENEAAGIEAIGDRLKAGTNCGSCIPEIQALLDEMGAKSATS